jgi:fused signal recognition particle receptor
MTGKKKRGLLSWLGFGDEEKAEQPTVEQQSVENTDTLSQAPSIEDSATESVVEDTELEQRKANEDATENNDNVIDDISEEDADKVEEQQVEEPLVELKTESVIEEVQEKPTESFFARLKRSLQRTKENIGAGFFGLFSGKKIDDDLFEELEEQLLIADVGMDTTVKIINSLTEKASKRDLKDGEALYGLLKEEMAEILVKVEKPLEIDEKNMPHVILMVGVNGVGKTTTIGKLAKQFQNDGKSVILAAGDTFRAAAVEQLQVWGQRNDVPVIAQHTGADSASVIYDAIEAAKARKVDVVIADTAGRLQNKSNLMEELRKIVRVMQKIDPTAPHEVMLTLDAGTGQNAISQAKLFSDVAPVTGITFFIDALFSREE